ncbi:MAG: hypothetical protein K2X81_20375, partial [Candidatus Obscuribacterales bacterium]|nr:hypothetical protein [Candidatus Obscuribacterales bacterium]
DIKMCGKNKDTAVELKNGLPEKIDTPKQSWERDAKNPQIWNISDSEDKFSLKADVKLQGTDVSARVKYENGRDVTYKNGEASEIKHPNGEVWTRDPKHEGTWNVSAPNRDDPSHPKQFTIQDVKVDVKSGDIKWHVDKGSGKNQDREIDAHADYHASLNGVSVIPGERSLEPSQAQLKQEESLSQIAQLPQTDRSGESTQRKTPVENPILQKLEEPPSVSVENNQPVTRAKEFVLRLNRPKAPESQTSSAETEVKPALQHIEQLDKVAKPQRIEEPAAISSESSVVKPIPIEPLSVSVRKSTDKDHQSDNPAPQAHPIESKALNNPMPTAINPAELSTHKIQETEPRTNTTSDLPNLQPQASEQHAFVSPQAKAPEQHDFVLPQPKAPEHHEFALPQPKAPEHHDIALPQPKAPEYHDIALPQPKAPEHHDIALPQPKAPEHHDIALPQPKAPEHHEATVPQAKAPALDSALKDKVAAPIPLRLESVNPEKLAQDNIAHLKDMQERMHRASEQVAPSLQKIAVGTLPIPIKPAEQIDRHPLPVIQPALLEPSRISAAIPMSRPHQDAISPLALQNKEIGTASAHKFEPMLKQQSFTQVTAPEPQQITRSAASEAPSPVPINYDRKSVNNEAPAPRRAEHSEASMPVFVKPSMGSSEQNSPEKVESQMKPTRLEIQKKPQALDTSPSVHGQAAHLDKSNDSQFKLKAETNAQTASEDSSTSSMLRPANQQASSPFKLGASVKSERSATPSYEGTVDYSTYKPQYAQEAHPAQQAPLHGGIDAQAHRQAIKGRAEQHLESRIALCGSGITSDGRKWTINPRQPGIRPLNPNAPDGTRVQLDLTQNGITTSVMAELKGHKSDGNQLTGRFLKIPGDDNEHLLSLESY